MSGLAGRIRGADPHRRFGTLRKARDALLEVDGLGGAATLGSRLRIEGRDGPVEAEVAAIDGQTVSAMAFDATDALVSGVRVELLPGISALRPCDAWLGRVVDGLGRPLDAGGPLPFGLVPAPFRSTPPPAAARGRVGPLLATGVRALDCFAPLCEGQRLGLFAGSGVGKSVLLSMLARWSDCDVAVIGLVGERGREVQEFIEDDLGPEGLARSIVVVATSDSPAVLRRQAAFTTLALAEHFRDRGLRVLCLMDSVTRFAMAQREIGLACGEPPATRGFTPSVFAELPRLLERAGPGLAGQGSITGLFTVLVDGDDHDEPIADAVRGILDGHVVLSRRIAERGRYPAMDLLRSVSRTLPHCLDPQADRTRLRAREVLATWADMEELVRLGAYAPGASAEVDRAIDLAPRIEAMVAQGKDDRGDPAQAFADLADILGETG
ncbi:flagellar protein export ATPase FliI [Sphingomonas swuensis]|uniref:Flagellar protein export ATPase FliI n=1 Tax=Sphingomonas swuensis TaxID=977800 RepID=A0ABP7SDW9_9SPHN